MDPMRVPRPEELLDRARPPEFSAQARALVAGRRIVVTGAAGSIGSELVRQLSRLDPEAVLHVDIDEGRLHALQLELFGEAFAPGSHVALADIRDKRGLDVVLRAFRPQVVFHAAALKHLNLLERFPCEGVRTNVFGTASVVAAARRAGAETFVNISTDKAADPISVLGATKRLAEVLARPADASSTRYASVRFGNVIGSRGSFYDTLVHQVCHGLPVTITHPDVTRFLMTIPEAAGLVIEAAALAQDGEIFVLDMGRPVRILDLVERFARHAGIPVPPVRITGLMPGEKLHEVLFSRGESDAPTPVPRVWRSPAPSASPALPPLLERLRRAVVAGDAARTRDLLALAVPSMNRTVSGQLPGAEMALSA